MLIDKFIYNDTILKQIFKIKEKDYCGDIIRKIEYNWKQIWKIEEFSKLESCEQNPKWHGEGNVKKHTILVCEYAEQFIKNYFSEKDDGWIYDDISFDDALLLLTSALFHDIGKIRTTKIGKDGNYHSYSHEFEGEKITRRLLWDTGYEFREKVCTLVRYHMVPLNLFERKDYMEEITRICQIVPSWDLLLELKKCDIYGSKQKDDKQREIDIKKLEELGWIGSAINNYIAHNLRRQHYYQKQFDSINKKPLSLIVMLGLPGSGKDTYIKDYYSGDNYAIICRDDIRAELGFCNENEKIVGTSKQENEVTELFNNKMLEAAKEGKTIVINNLNLKKEYRDSYSRMLSNYNLNITYVYVEASSLSKNIERREGQINEQVFHNIIEKFEWPTRNEYDHFIVAKN